MSEASKKLNPLKRLKKHTGFAKKAISPLNKIAGRMPGAGRLAALDKLGIGQKLGIGPTMGRARGKAQGLGPLGSQILGAGSNAPPVVEPLRRKPAMMGPGNFRQRMGLGMDAVAPEPPAPRTEPLLKGEMLRGDRNRYEFLEKMGLF